MNLAYIIHNPWEDQSPNKQGYMHKLRLRRFVAPDLRVCLSDLVGRAPGKEQCSAFTMGIDPRGGDSKLKDRQSNSKPLKSKCRMLIAESLKGL